MYDNLNQQQKAELMIYHLKSYERKYNREVFKGLAKLCESTINKLDESNIKKSLFEQYNNIVK